MKKAEGDAKKFPPETFKTKTKTAPKIFESKEKEEEEKTEKWRHREEKEKRKKEKKNATRLAGEERGPQEALGQGLEGHLAVFAWDNLLR